MQLYRAHISHIADNIHLKGITHTSESRIKIWREGQQDDSAGNSLLPSLMTEFNPQTYFHSNAGTCIFPLTEKY